MDHDEEPSDGQHQFQVGRLEGRVEFLVLAFTRIEAKLDSTLIRQDERVRVLEGEMVALKRLGTVIAVLWGSIIAGVAWLVNRGT